MIKFTCPTCGASHTRGYANGVDAFRCLRCGYVGTKNAAEVVGNIRLESLLDLVETGTEHRPNQSGDFVSHIDDPDSLGTLMGMTSDYTSSGEQQVGVIWSREPATGAKRQIKIVQRHIRAALSNIITLPNTKDAQDFAVMQMTRAMQLMKNDELISDWNIVDIDKAEVRIRCTTLASAHEISIDLPWNYVP